MIKLTSSPFGGQTRTRVLLLLRLLGESYPRELARVLQAPVSGVLRALRGLEADGLVAARPMGRIRLYRLEPRYFALEALGTYLDRLLEPEAALRERAGTLRRRPRHAGKPL
jgi:DNA-binding transcriptional ArsR family regulator